MDTRKFRNGQRVVIIRARMEVSVPGIFEIVKLMPETGGRNQYRIRSVLNGQERVAAELELEPAGR